MSNKKPLYRSLVDASGCGIGWDKKSIGDPRTGNHAGALVAQKPDDTLHFLQLTTDGKLIVDTEATSGQCKRVRGFIDAPATIDTYEDVAVLTLALTKIYGDMQVNLSCMTETEWELYYVNDVSGTPVETILDSWMSGPGQFNIQGISICDSLDTTGGTGVQELRVRAKNLTDCLSRVTATLSALESTP